MIRDITNPNDPRHGSLAGYRAHERAKHKPCDKCLVPRREQARKYAKPATSPCSICGTRCRSKIGVCKDCQRAANVGDAEVPKCANDCGRVTHRPSGLCRRCDDGYATELHDSDLLLDGWWVTAKSANGWLVRQWVAA